MATNTKLRAPVPEGSPRIDYLSKDYAGFRGQMLDALSARVPAWQERAAADLGISVVEVLAYAADYLSYHQDAVGTEAYLETARRRISLRRHARLLDYRVFEGTNARTWVAFEVSTPVVLPRHTRLLTRIGRLPTVLRPDSPAEAQALAAGAASFETLAETPLNPRHNAFRVDAQISPGLLGFDETSALLHGHHSELRRGQVLVFTGASGSPGHAVRLSAPPKTVTVLGVALTEVRWFKEDALPQHLRHLQSLRVRGNIVPAGHGQTLEERLPRVPYQGVYRPRLQTKELTFEEPFDSLFLETQPARAAMEQDAAQTLPAIVLFEELERRRRVGGGGGEVRWQPRYDLLDSSRFAPDFVVEIENDGHATLRFGEGKFGRYPTPGSSFRARYRVGLGPRGNLGPNTLRHVVTELAGIESLENPLQAVGGQVPESNDEVRRQAPFAFHRQLRCVADRDYVALALEQRGVRGANATRQAKPGGTQTVLRLQRPGGRSLDETFKSRIEQAFEPFLLLGTELEILNPLWTGIEIVLRITMARDVSPQTLAKALRKALEGFSHPDHFTFGEAVELEDILQRARRVPGVSAVLALTFQSLRPPKIDGLPRGKIILPPNEIAVLRNDPQRPELGRIHFELETVHGR